MLHDGADSGAGKLRFTFKKSERLCAKRSFDLLFRRRRGFNIGCLWVVYRLDLPADLVTAPLMVAFSAPKKHFKRAVQRNLIKRRMREAYRLYKHVATAAFREKGRNIAFLIKYNHKEIRSFKEIERDMRKVLQRIETLK